jgi:hypothetical protein
LRQAGAALADDLGPDAVSLARWRQQLLDGLGGGGDPAGGGPPSHAGPPPFADAFARGMPLTWSVAPGEAGPRLVWPEPDSAWLTRWLRTALLALLGVVGVWWSWRLGPGAWPEQFALLGVAAWAVEAGPLWVAPAAIGVTARLVLLGRTALTRWWPARQVPEAMTPDSQSPP